MIIKPPTFMPLIDDSGQMNTEWALFFNNIAIGDTGAIWTPTFTSLTEVGGTSTKVGTFFRISRKLLYFRVIVTPVTNTSAVAGTTYIGTLPFTIAAAGVCAASLGTTASANGTVVASTNRIYVPAWTTVTVPVTIVGTIEAA